METIDIKEVTMLLGEKDLVIYRLMKQIQSLQEELKKHEKQTTE